MWSASLFIFSLLLTFQSVSHTDLQDSVLIGAGSSITVKGSSTLHDWDAVSSTIQLNADLPEEWFQSKEAWNTEALTGIEVNMPVESLESGRRKMNSDIREALRSEQYPEIRFRSSSADLLSEEKDNGLFEFRLNGNLSLAGEESEVQFACTINAHEDQNLRTTCEMEINMTDFRVRPPTAFFGVLKTDEMVTVEIELVLVSSKE